MDVRMFSGLVSNKLFDIADIGKIFVKILSVYLKHSGWVGYSGIQRSTRVHEPEIGFGYPSQSSGTQIP